MQHNGDACTTLDKKKEPLVRFAVRRTLFHHLILYLARRRTISAGQNCCGPSRAWPCPALIARYQAWSQDRTVFFSPQISRLVLFFLSRVVNNNDPTGEFRVCELAPWCMAWLLSQPWLLSCCSPWLTRDQRWSLCSRSGSLYFPMQWSQVVWWQFHRLKWMINNLELQPLLVELSIEEGRYTGTRCWSRTMAADMMVANESLTNCSSRNSSIRIAFRKHGEGETKDRKVFSIIFLYLRFMFERTAMYMCGVPKFLVQLLAELDGPRLCEVFPDRIVTRDMTTVTTTFYHEISRSLNSQGSNEKKAVWTP